MNNLRTKLTKAGKWVKADSIRLFLSVGSLTFLGFAIFLYLSPYWQWADWTGLGADSNISTENTWENGRIKTTKVTKQFQSGKTLWDWLGLAGVIAIPIVLYQFQQQQQKRSEEQAEVEKEIAAINLREEALQDYIDKIAELLIDKRLKTLLKQLLDGIINKDNPELDAALDVARARTLSILRRLNGDGERKSSVVRFLIDAELIQGLELLKEANLSQANLSGVNFSQADLARANLFKANLFKANFSEANLFKANFSEANLSEANFGSTGLLDANFKGVKNLTPEQIKKAKNWEQAIYDSDFRNQLGLPPEIIP